MNDHQHELIDDREHGDEPTQGENPGAQGDFGAGQGEPGFEPDVTDDPTVGRDGDRVEEAEQPRVDETRLDDVDGGGAGEQPMGDDQPLDAAGEDEPIAPYDRDPGEDATMTNGGNATR